jgi:hypothetical protein
VGGSALDCDLLCILCQVDGLNLVGSALNVELLCI